MLDNLDASIFEQTPNIYEKEFERVLIGITCCYQMMINDGVRVPNNDEDKIRNRLYVDYLDKDLIKQKLNMTQFRFECESAEIDPISYTEKGYVDIKVLSPNSFEHTKEYYIIECKRIDGHKRLNRDYIQDGIIRFVSKKYPSFYGINGMIGFVVKAIDIDQNTTEINRILNSEFSNTNTTLNLRKKKFISDFEYSYESEHSEHKDNCGNRLKLYHLMFDFSSNMEELN